MDKERFKKLEYHFDILRNEWDKILALEKRLLPEIEANFNFHYGLIEGYAKLLGEYCNNPEAVNDFIFEQDFGRNSGISFKKFYKKELWK